MCALATAVVIGAVIGGAAYTVAALFTGNFTWGGLAQSIIVGAVSGAITCGIGDVALGIKVGKDAMSISSQLLRETARAGMHGLAQGCIAGITGGNFRQAFVSGALASIGASVFAWDGNGAGQGLGWADSVRNNDYGQLLYGTVSGGVGAELTGGNFWQGAVTGLIVSGVNHLGHQGAEDFSDLGGDDTPLDGTEATVRNEINASPKLSRLYKNSGSYELQASKLEYGLNPDGTQSNTIVGKTLGMNPNDPNEGNLRSIFFQSAFRQGSKFLRITIAHELTHGYNKLNGIFLHNFNSYRKQGFSGDGAYTRAVRLDELYAYKIGSMFGGVTYYNQDPNPWHYNPTKMFK